MQVESVPSQIDVLEVQTEMECAATEPKQDLPTQQNDFKSVQGEPDQVCENLKILSLIQARYIHILSNEFRGNASGKIGKAEAMICDCIYDKGQSCY